jgi:hypothetical protein
MSRDNEPLAKPATMTSKTSH